MNDIHQALVGEVSDQLQRDFFLHSGGVGEAPDACPPAAALPRLQAIAEETSSCITSPSAAASTPPWLSQSGGATSSTLRNVTTASDQEAIALLADRDPVAAWVTMQAQLLPPPAWSRHQQQQQQGGSSKAAAAAAAAMPSAAGSSSTMDSATGAAEVVPCPRLTSTWSAAGAAGVAAAARKRSSTASSSLPQEATAGSFQAFLVQQPQPRLRSEALERLLPETADGFQVQQQQQQQQPPPRTPAQLAAADSRQGNLCNAPPPPQQQQQQKQPARSSGALHMAWTAAAAGAGSEEQQSTHALLAALNPLESVLWQQRQHQKALLERALHALTSLQADVDSLLQQQAELQADGASIAAAASMTALAAEAAQAPLQQAPRQQQQFQQLVATLAQAEPGQRARLLPRVPLVQHQQMASAAVAADAADCAAGVMLEDFEAELLQQEAAAPGRRLSDSTLRQYYAAQGCSEAGEQEQQQACQEAEGGANPAEGSCQAPGWQDTGPADTAADSAAGSDGGFEAQLRALEASAPGRRLPEAEAAAAEAAAADASSDSCDGWQPRPGQQVDGVGLAARAATGEPTAAPGVGISCSDSGGGAEAAGKASTGGAAGFAAVAGVPLSAEQQQPQTQQQAAEGRAAAHRRLPSVVSLSAPLTPQTPLAPELAAGHAAERAAAAAAAAADSSAALAAPDAAVLSPGRTVTFRLPCQAADKGSIDTSSWTEPQGQQQMAMPTAAGALLQPGHCCSLQRQGTAAGLLVQVSSSTTIPESIPESDSDPSVVCDVAAGGALQALAGVCTTRLVPVLQQHASSSSIASSRSGSRALACAPSLAGDTRAAEQATDDGDDGDEGSSDSFEALMRQNERAARQAAGHVGDTAQQHEDRWWQVEEEQQSHASMPPGAALSDPAAAMPGARRPQASGRSTADSIGCFAGGSMQLHARAPGSRDGGSRTGDDAMPLLNLGCIGSIGAVADLAPALLQCAPAANAARQLPARPSDHPCEDVEPQTAVADCGVAAQEQQVHDVSEHACAASGLQEEGVQAAAAPGQQQQCGTASQGDSAPPDMAEAQQQDESAAASEPMEPTGVQDQLQLSLAKCQTGAWCQPPPPPPQQQQEDQLMAGCTAAVEVASEAPGGFVRQSSSSSSSSSGNRSAGCTEEAAAAVAAMEAEAAIARRPSEAWTTGSGGVDDAEASNTASAGQAAARLASAAKGAPMLEVLRQQHDPRDQQQQQQAGDAARVPPGAAGDAAGSNTTLLQGSLLSSSSSSSSSSSNHDALSGPETAVLVLPQRCSMTENQQHSAAAAATEGAFKSAAVDEPQQANGVLPLSARLVPVGRAPGAHRALQQESSANAADLSTVGSSVMNLMPACSTAGLRDSTGCPMPEAVAAPPAAAVAATGNSGSSRAGPKAQGCWQQGQRAPAGPLQLGGNAFDGDNFEVRKRNERAASRQATCCINAPRTRHQAIHVGSSSSSFVEPAPAAAMASQRGHSFRSPDSLEQVAASCQQARCQMQCLEAASAAAAAAGASRAKAAAVSRLNAAASGGPPHHPQWQCQQGVQSRTGTHHHHQQQLQHLQHLHIPSELGCGCGSRQGTEGVKGIPGAPAGCCLDDDRSQCDRAGGNSDGSDSSSSSEGSWQTQDAQHGWPQHAWMPPGKASLQQEDSALTFSVDGASTCRHASSSSRVSGSTSVTGGQSPWARRAAGSSTGCHACCDLCPKCSVAGDVGGQCSTNDDLAIGRHAPRQQQQCRPWPDEEPLGLSSACVAAVAGRQLGRRLSGLDRQLRRLEQLARHESHEQLLLQTELQLQQRRQARQQQRQQARDAGWRFDSTCADAESPVILDLTEFGEEQWRRSSSNHHHSPSSSKRQHCWQQQQQQQHSSGSIDPRPVHSVAAFLSMPPWLPMKTAAAGVLSVTRAGGAGSPLWGHTLLQECMQDVVAEQELMLAETVAAQLETRVAALGLELTASAAGSTVGQ